MPTAARTRAKVWLIVPVLGRKSPRINLFLIGEGALSGGVVLPWPKISQVTA